MKDRVTTGIEALDTLIGSLFVGGNVIWYDNAGSLADVFYLNLIRSSLQIIKAENRTPDRRGKPFPYFSRDAAIRFNPDAQSTGRIDLGAGSSTKAGGLG